MEHTLLSIQNHSENEQVNFFKMRLKTFERILKYYLCHLNRFFIFQRINKPQIALIIGIENIPIFLKFCEKYQVNNLPSFEMLDYFKNN